MNKAGPHVQKNSSRSTRYVRDEINNLENRDLSFVKEDACRWVFDFFIVEDGINSEMFLLIGSLVGFVWSKVFLNFF